jgi:hypothetical protein
MIEFLKLCGFAPQEMDTELPRVERAFEKLGITAGDIELAKQRLNTYYNVELEGVRKAIRLLVLEMVNSILAREEGKKHIIFGFMIPGFESIGSAFMSKSKDVFYAHHSWAFLFVVGCIFGKLVPILEAAEKKWLKAGAVTHCANVKTLLGLLSLDIIPEPDLLLTSGFLCETAPKTIDLLHEYYGMQVYSWDTCHDRGAGEGDSAARRSIDLTVKSLKRLVRKVEDMVGFEITDDELWNAIETRSRFDNTMGMVQNLVHSSDPLPLSPPHDNIWMCVSSLTYDDNTVSKAMDAADTLYKEVKELVDKGVGAVPKGAPRVLGEIFAHHGDPRLEHLAYEMGIAMMSGSSAMRIEHDRQQEDPYWILSRDWGGGMSAGIRRKMAMHTEMCRAMHIDGVLNRYHAGCRAVAGDALLIQKTVEKELKIPALLLEWENFDPRIYKHEEYKRRLEVFKTMMTR